MHEFERAIIVAYDKNRAIGSNNHLPWMCDMRDDMRRFREMTLNHTVIMGRKTYESIGRPLPQRTNIVLSRSALTLAGCIVHPTLEAAFAATKNDEKVFIIGGASVYEQALSYVDTIYATEIDTVIENADAFFPELSDQTWRQESQMAYPADTQNKFPYRYVTYVS